MPAKDQQGPTGLRTIVQKRMMDDVLHNTMSECGSTAPFWRGYVMMYQYSPPPDSCALMR